MKLTVLYLLVIPTVLAAQVFILSLPNSKYTKYVKAPAFIPPGPGPTEQSPNYVGASNGSLHHEPIIPGRVFDRFIQVMFLQRCTYS